MANLLSDLGFPNSSRSQEVYASIMDLRRAVGEYLSQGRELLYRLRSPEEGPTVTPVDLHILRVQLFLLDHEAANMQQRHMQSSPTEPAQVQLKQGISNPPGKPKAPAETLSWLCPTTFHRTGSPLDAPYPIASAPCPDLSD